MNTFIVVVEMRMLTPATLMRALSDPTVPALGIPGSSRVRLPHKGQISLHMHMGRRGALHSRVEARACQCHMIHLLTVRGTGTGTGTAPQPFSNN